MKKTKANLTTGPEVPIITRMAAGMFPGFAAMAAFNAVDTYFVGQLGTTELAAMSFTFPVVMLLHSISAGLGIGLSSVISRAIGSGNHAQVKRLTTDGLALSLLIVFIMSVCGILTIRPLFSVLGAEPHILPLVKNYMMIWYLGITFVVIPMAGNNVIRATGDTLTPSMIMIIAVVINVILDPLLIFGIGPFPALGISGAALATVVSRCATLFLSLYVLHFREHLLSFIIPKWSELLNSWRRIIFIGAPAGLVQTLMPVSIGVITRLLADYGEETVAGFGAAGRVEMLVLMIPMSFAAVMAPFAGQNWGAGKVSRILRGIKFSSLVSIAWGLIIFTIFINFAEPILALFNSHRSVVQAGALYLKIAGFSFGFTGLLAITSQCFNALNKPVHAAGITITRAFILNVPLALAGAYFWQARGIFIGTFITNILSGIAGFIILALFLKHQEDPQPQEQ